MIRQRAMAAAVAGMLLLAFAVPHVVNTARRLCEAPVDVSGTQQLPSLLLSIKERDEIAFPAHALLGSVLQERECDASAVTLQWLKAGSHARGESEIERTADGLRRVLAASAQPVKIRREICDTVRDHPRAELHASVERAGVSCEGDDYSRS